MHIQKRLYLFYFTAQLWKFKDDEKLLNKLRQWPYYFRNTAIPKVGNTGQIKVYDRGLEKILVFHNFTKAVELAENVSSLESYYTWQWKVEAADAEGWSKITNPDGLYLTSKLTGKSSKLAVEKEGKLKKKK